MAAATQSIRRRPGRPRKDPAAASTSELILDAAVELFARRGYEGAGLREIAAAAAVDVATVSHHFGSKAQLHDAVFARMYAAESQTLHAAAERVRASVPTGRPEMVAGLHQLLDAYLDFLDSHPEVTYLWLRRWLEPARHGHLDDEYALPLYRLVEELLPAEPDPHVAVRSIVWAVHGHVTAEAAAPGAAARRERESFRAFMHRLVDALWGNS